jgi:WXG100 family type VII secretion target
MSTIKVTPEQLHHVSNQVGQARQQLEHIQDNLSKQIMFLQAVWLGVTQERFYGDFARSRTVLQKALESMVYTSKELTEIATRFEQADAEKGSLGGVIGAVGAAMLMKSSGSDTGSEDKGYRMAQVNVFGRLVQMPVNEDGVTDQAALQAYQKDQGHLDFNRMQAVGTEEPGEDIIALQIKAFENGIHPFTGEPVNDQYAQMMVISLKFSQILMAFQMVRGSMPGRKGPFHLPSSHPTVAKMKANVANAEKASVNNKIHEVNPSHKFTGSGMKDYDKVAEMEYEFIRQTKMHDIKDVAANTGLSVDEIRAMKKHLFFGKHQVPQPGGKEFKMERFIADDEIAYAWKTAQKGELSVEQKSWFKQLADHELVERKLMAEGQKYRTLESWNPITGRYDGFPPGAHENAPKQPRASFPGYEEYFFNKSFK